MSARITVSEKPSRVLAGGLMIIGGMFVIGFVDNLIRIIEQESGLWQFHVFRSVVGCSIIALYCMIRKQNLRPKRYWAVVVRGFLMAWAILLYFGALSLMPIAEAGATLFSSPIFVIVFSVILYRMKIGIWRILAVTLGFTGVLLVLKPSPDNIGFLTLLPMLAGILYALGQLATRHLCSEENTTVVMMGFFLMIGLLSLLMLVLLHFLELPSELVDTAPFFLRGWEVPTDRFLFWISIQALGSIVGIMGLIRGYQIAEPTYVGIFEYSFLIFAGFWGWMLWGEIPDSVAFVGIVAIITAGIAIALRSRKQ